jgi:hypothetical protein
VEPDGTSSRNSITVSPPQPMSALSWCEQPGTWFDIRWGQRLGSASFASWQQALSVGFGVTNLAPPVASGSVLCVVVGEETGGKGGAGRRMMRPC